MKKNLKTYVVLGLAVGTVLASSAVAFAGTGEKSADFDLSKGWPGIIKAARG